MTEFLMTTWDGAGTTPPLMSVARALVQRGHHVRVLADAVLRPDVEAAGAEHVSWTRAPQRTAHGRDGDFIRDWEAKEPGGDFARMRDRQVGALVMAAWDEALPALNEARAEQGLPPVEHVLEQGRSAARVLVLTSRAFDFVGPLPPVVKYVGPRLDDPAWAQEWQAPAGDDPPVLVALSMDFQDHAELLQRI